MRKRKYHINEKKAIDLYIEYKEIKEVSKVFNCTYICIYKILRKNNIKLFPKKVWNKGLKGQEYKKHYKNGMGGQFKKNQVSWSKNQKKNNSEWARRQSDRMKINNPMLYEKFRKKISDAKKGRKFPNISKARKGMESPMKGKKHSMKSRLKMSISKKRLFKENPNLSLAIKRRRQKQILPVKDTKIEVRIQNFLKQLGIEFFTHQYMKQIEHGYQCDILIPSMNLVIECDGNYWHKYPIGTEIDHIRTKELLEKGFKVLRLWGSEIKIMKIEDFKKKIKY